MPINHIAAGWAKCHQAKRGQHLISLAHAPVDKLSQTVSNHTTLHFPSPAEVAVIYPGGSNCLDSRVIGHNKQDKEADWTLIMPSIVLVSSAGSGWASGIVLSRAGCILTNAHVVKPGTTGVQTAHDAGDDTDFNLPLFDIRLSSGSSHSWHVAEVVYTFRHALDLAVLRIKAAPDSLHLQPAALHSGILHSGQAVAVIGHGLFSPKLKMQPSVTAGNITKVHSRS